MTAQELRSWGYLVVFRLGLIIREKDGKAEFQPVDNGAWAKRPESRWQFLDLSAGDALAQELAAVRQHCYCRQAGVDNCDFCSGLRSIPQGG